MIEGYVEKRATLALFLTLIDARRDLGGEERQLIEWLDSLAVPHRLVVTKIDKLSTTARGALGDRMRRALPTACPRRCWSRARPARASTACGRDRQGAQ